MLKIKEEVNLKELEKFGFEELPYKYWRDIDNQWGIIVYKDNRKIVCWNFAYGNYKNAEKYVEDLIQAGLVEKVD